MVYIKLLFLILGNIALCFDQGIISGNIKDQNGDGIKDAKVVLKNSGIFTHTKADGSFTLKSNVGINDNIKNGCQQVLNMRVKNGLMYLSVDENSSFAITTYSLLGKHISSIKGILPSGTHTIPLPQTSAGVYLSKLKLGNREFPLKGYALDGFLFDKAITNIDLISKGTANNPGIKKIFKDTLEVTKNGYMNKNGYVNELIPIENPDTSGIEAVLYPYAVIGRLGNRPEDFQAFGLNEDEVELWEDGIRQEGSSSGEYEWWYINGYFSNGMILVTSFRYRNGAPSINLDISDENKTYINRGFPYQASEFSAKKEMADVKISSNYFKCVNGFKRYEIFIDPAKHNGYGVKLQIDNKSPAYRPGTGFWVNNDENDDRYFAWLCAVPCARIHGTLTIKNQVHDVDGVGYHDHNWGNAPMNSLIGGWDWGQGDIGGNSLVMASVRFNRANGGVETPLLYIADGDNIIIDALNDELEFQGINNSSLRDCIFDINNSLGYAKVKFEAKDAMVNGGSYRRYRSITTIDIKMNGYDIQAEDKSISEYMILAP